MPKTKTIQQLVQDNAIPPEVEKLAKTGSTMHKEWGEGSKKKDAKKLIYIEINSKKVRSSGWIERTFKVNEAKIIQSLGKLDPPPTYSIGDLNSALEGKPTKNSEPTFTLVEGVSVNDLHKASLGGNCVLQVASQFNFLESMTKELADVSEYTADKTQGPQASIEAAAASLHRKAAHDKGKLPHALTEVIPTALLDICYKNGYLEPSLLNSSQKEQLLNAINANIDKLTVLPQWALCEASGAKQLQVFTAAPSYQGIEAIQDDTDKAICKALVVAQYKATAQLAVIRSRETGERVPLHLTLVGQGAFKNDPSVLAEAMSAVNEVLKGENVAVYVHAYSTNDVSLAQNFKGSMEFNGPIMDAKSFMSQEHPGKSKDLNQKKPPPQQQVAGPSVPPTASPVAVSVVPPIMTPPPISASSVAASVVPLTIPPLPPTPSPQVTATSVSPPPPPPSDKKNPLLQAIRQLKSQSSNAHVMGELMESIKKLLQEALPNGKGNISLRTLDLTIDGVLKDHKDKIAIKEKWKELTAPYRGDGVYQKPAAPPPAENVTTEPVLPEQREPVRPAAVIGLHAGPSAAPAPQDALKPAAIRNTQVLELSPDELAAYQSKTTQIGLTDALRESFIQALNSQSSTANQMERMDQLKHVAQYFVVASSQQMKKILSTDSPDRIVFYKAEAENKFAQLALQQITLCQAMARAGTRIPHEKIEAAINVQAEKLGDRNPDPDNVISKLLSTQLDVSALKNTYDSSKGIVGIATKNNTQGPLVKISNDGKSVNGRILFNNKDLYAGGAKGAQEHAKMKTQMNDLLTIGIVEAGKGTAQNPIALNLTKPECHELAVQAVLDLKERALLEGRTFHLTIAEELKKDPVFMGMTTFEIGPNTQLTPQEAAAMDYFAAQKSANSAHTAGATVFKYENIAQTKDQKPSVAWGATLEQKANDLKTQFESQKEKLSEAVPQPNITAALKL